MQEGHLGKQIIFVSNWMKYVLCIEGKEINHTQKDSREKGGRHSLLHHSSFFLSGVREIAIAAVHCRVTWLYVFFTN